VPGRPIPSGTKAGQSAAAKADKAVDALISSGKIKDTEKQKIAQAWNAAYRKAGGEGLPQKVGRADRPGAEKKKAAPKVSYHNPTLSTEGRELRLFVDNDSDLYRQQTTPIHNNLKRKIAKGIYDHTKAVKLWQYLVDNGARKYVKEFGGVVRTAFPKAERTKVAQAMADSFYKEHLAEKG
jgi:hypothetical protein